MRDLVLASASPRRKQLLEQMGLEFSVIASKVAETVASGLSPGAVAESLAGQKARDVANSLSSGLVIGADTIVVQQDQKGYAILGKPEDSIQAAEMLKGLSGSTHQVITGIALVDVETGKELLQHQVTTVNFRELEAEEITAYVATGEPLDKAGAYGIQGLGALFVTGIEGCYFNVVGLPLARLGMMLKEFGISVLRNI